MKENRPEANHDDDQLHRFSDAWLHVHFSVSFWSRALSSARFWEISSCRVLMAARAGQTAGQAWAHGMMCAGAGGAGRETRTVAPALMTGATVRGRKKEGSRVLIRRRSHPAMGRRPPSTRVRVARGTPSARARTFCERPRRSRQARKDGSVGFSMSSFPVGFRVAGSAA